MESEEEQRFCNNCKRYVAAANFSVHSAFCERNIFVCTKCDEPVKISEKDKHLEDYHVTSVCNLCEAQLEKWLLPNHMDEVCPKRLVECKYCESNLPVDEYAEHIEFCGSRTEKCLSCRKYVMVKNKSEHDEIHLLEKQCHTKSVEDEIKQNKVNEVISKKSTAETICEKLPENINSMPSKISEEDICLSDNYKNKCKERNFEIPAHERGAASLSERVTSKHFNQCHICKQNIPWIDFNTHLPTCASSAGKCALCGERVTSYEMKEHMRNHFQGKVNMSFKVPENESSNETMYVSNQSNSAKSKTYSSVMKCPYCSEVCSEDQVLEHTRSCLKNIYKCPLCGENVPEKDKKQHEEFQCTVVHDNTESNTSHFSRHSQSNSECPLCRKLIPEENYDVHVTLHCEQLSRVADTHGLYAAGEDLYTCVYCSEKMPQKEKNMHNNFLCKVLIESCGINISDSYADVTKKTNPNSSKNDELSVSCPTCKNTFPKERILHHKSKCSRKKEPCTYCKAMIDVACADIHLQYCPGIDNRDHSHHNTVAHDSRSSDCKHKGAIPKNTSIRDMMKPRSAKCQYCCTSYNVDILPNHEMECIHMPIQCDICDQEIFLKDVNTHKCKRRKGKFQNRQQSTPKENSEGGIWTKAKKMFGVCNEKEARNTNFMHNKHHSESQAYVPDGVVERKERLYFEQIDDPPLPCEFCLQEFPASQLVLHMTGCQPDLVSYAKSDSPEKLDSKQESGKKDSVAAFKSQNIHSAYGINNPFFAKNNSVSTHDASELIEHKRKPKADELSQSCYDKKSEHHENSKNENDVEKKSLNFQSVWNVTNTLNFINDHLMEIDKETDETSNLNKKQKEKELDQQTSEKHIIKSSSDNEMNAMLTFLNEEKNESDEEYLSFSDENVEQTNSEINANSSTNPQNIQEMQGESPLLKKMTNEEKSKEVSQDTLKSSGKTERSAEEHLKQLSAGFRFGAHKNGHWDIQSEKKCEDLNEPSKFSERSKNQKEYIRYSESLSDLKLGRYQSAAISGDANINEMIGEEQDMFLVKRGTKFSGSPNDQKNHTNNSKLQANINFYSNNGTDFSTVLFNELEHPKLLPKEHNKEPNELYSQNNSRLSGTAKDDFEYICNYRQHLPDFKYGLETIRKHSEDNVTNVTLPENRSNHNLNRAFKLEPAGSPMESKLPLHTVLKTGVKEIGLEERIAAFELNKKILSSEANNNVNVKKWRERQKKKDDFDISDSD